MDELDKVITKETIEDAVKQLKKARVNLTGYSYFLPSKTEGKRLEIHGWLRPGEAAKIAQDIWTGKNTVDDYDCVQEIDIY